MGTGTSTMDEDSKQRASLVSGNNDDSVPLKDASAEQETGDEVEVVPVGTEDQERKTPPNAPEKKPSTQQVTKSVDDDGDDADQNEQQQPTSTSAAAPQSGSAAGDDGDVVVGAGASNEGGDGGDESDPRLVHERLNSGREPSFRVDWSMEYLNLRHRRYLFREFLDFYNQFRYNCGMLVNNGHVQFAIIVLIAVNALMMGIGTFDVVKDNPEVENIFETVDFVFLVIFTVELGMQFVYHGWRLILDGWLVFDLIIITTSWSFQSVQIIRAFRIFRALRLVTRIKIMKNLILALFGVMPRMAAIGLMLFLIFYIFAVMFTQLFKDMYKNGEIEEKYFTRIDGTFFTLFQIMTLDAWADIARQVIRVYKWAWLPFIAFVIISGFIVVNLIIAVICDAIAALHKDDKAKIHGTFEGGDGGTDSENESSQQLEIREQLDSLEEQMEELTRIQAKTFHTLQYLTRQLQMHKLKQELKTAPAAKIADS